MSNLLADSTARLKELLKQVLSEADPDKNDAVRGNTASAT
jgi:hypothetical protein